MISYIYLLIMENSPPKHIHYTVYEPDEIVVRGAILLLHGMQEHSGRYTVFANYLKDHGYAVIAYDHSGHGKTAKTTEQLGFFHKKQPGMLLVSEARHMAEFLAYRFPSVPRILFGHSMGSFVARVLLKKSSSLFHAAILMGTGGPNSTAALFLPVLYVVNLVSPNKRSRWLNHLFSLINNREFKHEHPNDGTNWLSVNPENRKAFLADELSGVDFSNNAFYGLIALNVEATKSDWAQNISRNFPMLFVSGSADPIGNYGKGVCKTVNALKEKGFAEVTIKLYTGMRHEILNEHQNNVVFLDIIKWLNQINPKKDIRKPDTV